MFGKKKNSKLINKVIRLNDEAAYAEKQGDLIKVLSCIDRALEMVGGIKEYQLLNWIVGGGPAGLAAAASAKKNGIDKILILESFMLFQRKIDGAMKKLHEGSDAAEEERRKEAGEPYEEMERPELEKGDIPAMIIAAFITFIPVAILVLGIILVAGYFLLH